MLSRAYDQAVAVGALEEGGPRPEWNPVSLRALVANGHLSAAVAAVRVLLAWLRHQDHVGDTVGGLP